MGVMTGQAIACDRRVHHRVSRAGLDIVVAGHALRRGRGLDQLDARYIFSLLIAALDNADLVAGETAHLHRAVHRRAFGLVLMTIDAFCGIDVGVQGHWVPLGRAGNREGSHQQ